jgi:hypothetical protein
VHERPGHARDQGQAKKTAGDALEPVGPALHVSTHRRPLILAGPIKRPMATAVCEVDHKASTPPIAAAIQHDAIQQTAWGGGAG